MRRAAACGGPFASRSGNVRQDRAAAQSAQSALLEMKSRLPEPVAEPVPGAPDEDGGVPAESAEPEPPAYVTDPSMPMPVQEIDGEGTSAYCKSRISRLSCR